MCDNYHLPVAAALSDLSDLKTFEVSSLSSMADECVRWLSDIEKSRTSIVTPAAKTLWAILVQGEVEHVTKTHNHLLHELSSRQRQGLCDA